MYLREGEEEYHLVENDCILLDPTRKHVGYRTSVCNFLYVHFSQDIREVSAVGKDACPKGTILIQKVKSRVGLGLAGRIRISGFPNIITWMRWSGLFDAGRLQGI